MKGRDVLVWLAVSAMLIVGRPQAMQIERTFDRPDVIDAALSPAGDRIAITVWTRNTQVIAVLDARSGEVLSKTNIGVVYADWIEWANDDRLLVGVSRAQRIAGVFRVESSRVVSLDASGEGKPVVLLRDETKDAEGWLSIGTLVSRLPDDPTHVLVPGPDGDRTALYRVDVYTGDATVVARGGRRTYGFATDARGTPSIRFDESDDGRSSVVLKQTSEGEWTRVRSVRFSRQWRDTATSKEFWPVTALPRQGHLIAVARPDGEEFSGLWSYDLVADVFGERLAQASGGDIDGAILDSVDGSLLGYVTTKHLAAPVFFDKTLQAHADGLTVALGPDAELTFLDVSKHHDMALLYAAAPDDPGGFYVYDFAKRDVKVIGLAYEDLWPRQFGKTWVARYPSRDGIMLEAYVTNPSAEYESSGLVPLLIMPHGGPEARDTMAYDPMVQFFASRGYRVIRPYFRGSSGKGRQFAEAGYGEWAGLMQQDVTDAALWAYDQGLGRPSHTCVLGASYGAYAALIEAALRPELYACVVAMSGPSDLDAFLRDRKRAFGAGSDTYTYWVRSMGGGGALDRKVLAAASPTTYAKTWRLPTLLVHGVFDTVVPYDQSVVLHRKLAKRNDVEVKLISMRSGHQLGGEGPSLYVLDQADEFLEGFIARSKPAEEWTGRPSP